MFTPYDDIIAHESKEFKPYTNMNNQQKQQILSELLSCIEIQDNNLSTSTKFINYQTKEDGNSSKYHFIRNMLHECTHAFISYSCPEITVETDKLLKQLDIEYQNNQHMYCWQSHMSHFHMSLEAWINCPMTCFAEVQEFVEKIIKKDN